MSIIGIFAPANNLTLKRVDGPTVYVKGTAQAIGTTSTDFTGSVQPPDGIQLQSLTELQRTLDVRMVYTETELKTVDKTNGLSADVVEYEGSDYVVTKVEPFADWDGGDLGHYEVTIIKEDE